MAAVTAITGEWETSSAPLPSRPAREDARAELGRVESDVAVVEARVTRDKDRLQGTSSVKDAQALEQELAALAKRQSDLEDIELAVMETVDEREAELADTRAAMDALDGRIAEATAARDAATGSLDQERQHAAANRATIAAKIPAELLALYEKQRERYGWGASYLQGGVTSVSGVKLNANDMGAIRAAALVDDVLLRPELERDPGAQRGVWSVTERELIVEADGGLRGNPGVAAGGLVVIDPATGEVLA